MRTESLQQKQHMSRNHKGWKIDRLGGRFSFVDAAVPEVRPWKGTHPRRVATSAVLFEAISQANSRPIAHRRTSFRVIAEAVLFKQRDDSADRVGGLVGCLPDANEEEIEPCCKVRTDGVFGGRFATSLQRQLDAKPGRVDLVMDSTPRRHAGTHSRSRSETQLDMSNNPITNRIPN